MKTYTFHVTASVTFGVNIEADTIEEAKTILDHKFNDENSDYFEERIDQNRGYHVYRSSLAEEWSTTGEADIDHTFPPIKGGTL